MHTILAIDAHPRAHEFLKKEMEKRKYYHEGGRKGYNIAAVSEIRFYNIRMKKGTMPFLLRDLRTVNAIDLSEQVFVGQNYHTKQNWFKRKMFKFLFWLIRKTYKKLGIHLEKSADGKINNLFPGYYYCMQLASFKDPEREWGEEL